MNFIRYTIKILVFFLLVVTFLLISFIADLVVRDRKKKLITFSKIASFYGNAGLIVLGIKVRQKNLNPYLNAEQNYMILSNHLSYMDIFIIYSVLPSVFVANTELEDEFPLGAVTKYGGGIFVERRNRSRLLDDMQNISSVLDMGLNIVMFPEGTTSDGSGVSAFKAPFLKSAINTGTSVLPICINYKKINNENIGPSNKDLLFYYGDITFFEHFFRLLKIRHIEVELQALDVIEVNPKMTRKDLSLEAYSRISSAYMNI